MTIPSIEEMLKAGVHFGHQTSRWHPKMKPFIFMKRNNVHIINLEETKKQLELIVPEIKNMAAEGKNILFVSTKPQAKEVVQKAATECNMPYLTDRWLGGLLTNFKEMDKLIKKYNTLKAQQASGELEKYTKKEQLDIKKDLEKMDLYIGGLRELKKIPDVVFIPSVQKEKTAVTEAGRMGVPIIGVCDTNANPIKVAYPIPGNDDALKAIILIVDVVTQAIKEGQEIFVKKQAEKATMADAGSAKKA